MIQQWKATGCYYAPAIDASLFHGFLDDANSTQRMFWRK